ncbi:hypothetical protein Alg130_11045 [Pyrenophora tritici-repentis]|nr:hypothetical protein Alg130_11045 [Pyrenophora tritici-repentis]
MAAEQETGPYLAQEQEPTIQELEQSIGELEQEIARIKAELNQQIQTGSRSAQKQEIGSIKAEWEENNGAAQDKIPATHESPTSPDPRSTRDTAQEKPLTELATLLASSSTQPQTQTVHVNDFQDQNNTIGSKTASLPVELLEHILFYCVVPSGRRAVEVDFSVEDKHGHMSLYAASTAGYANIVKILRNKKANAGNKRGRTLSKIRADDKENTLKKRKK